MSVAEVALMRRSAVDLGLVQRVLDLVGEDASRKTRDNLLGSFDVCSLKNVVVDQEIVAQERKLVECEL